VQKKPDLMYETIIIIIIIITTTTTAIEFSLGGSSSYTNADKTNKNKYTETKQYKNTVQTIQNTVNTSTHTHITKTPTRYKTLIESDSTICCMYTTVSS
jgi:flagellar basal body-associated protein FliL